MQLEKKTLVHICAAQQQPPGELAGDRPARQNADLGPHCAHPALRGTRPQLLRRHPQGFRAGTPQDELAQLWYQYQL